MTAGANARRRQDKQAGFTFVEILAAMMILFILIGAAGFAYFRYVSKARVVAAKNQIQTLELALNSYFLDAGAYPTGDQGLMALWEKPVLEPVPKGWNGPYLTKKLPLDPWGNEYVYRVPGPSGLPFGILSLGSDGMDGGEGEASDILSWGD
jgi:general secretion pathway protein G